MTTMPIRLRSVAPVAATVLLGLFLGSVPVISHAASNHPRVSVIGLGRMGSSLAKAFLSKGFNVTVWNRTASKAQPLVSAGAVLAASPTDAIADSPLTIISLSAKPVSRSILTGSDVSAALRGHTIVDLSTGSPAEARSASEYVVAAGGSYLDGAILAYPREIGTNGATILYAGSADTFRANAKALAVLASDQHYMGEDPGAAATANLAGLDYFFVAAEAYMEGAALAQAVGIKLDQFRAIAAAHTRKLDPLLEEINRRIKAGDYADDQAPLNDYSDAFKMIRQALIEKGLGHEAVDSFLSYAESAKKANDGDKDLAVLYRTIGGRNENR